MVCRFSEGGITATILAIRHPGSVRALVNDAGYDMLNPQGQHLHDGTGAARGLARCDEC